MNYILQKKYENCLYKIKPDHIEQEHSQHYPELVQFHNRSESFNYTTGNLFQRLNPFFCTCKSNKKRYNGNNTKQPPHYGIALQVTVMAAEYHINDEGNTYRCHKIPHE